MSDNPIPLDENHIKNLIEEAGFSVSYFLECTSGRIKFNVHGTHDGVTFAMLEELTVALGSKEINLGDEHGYYAGEHDSWIEVLNPSVKP